MRIWTPSTPHECEHPSHGPVTHRKSQLYKWINNAWKSVLVQWFIYNHLNMLHNLVRISGSLRLLHCLRRTTCPVWRSRQYHTWVCVPSPQEREHTDQPASSQKYWLCRPSPSPSGPGFFFRWDFGGMLHVTVTLACSRAAPGTIFCQKQSSLLHLMLIKFT